jgi:hypothetical protein
VPQVTTRACEALAAAAKHALEEVILGGGSGGQVGKGKEDLAGPMSELSSQQKSSSMTISTKPTMAGPPALKSWSVSASGVLRDLFAIAKSQQQEQQQQGMIHSTPQKG